MITDLFTVENGKVKPSLHCHLIPEFKQIIDKYEKRSTDMLAYAFYYACPFKSINPYADYSDDEKEDILKKKFVVFPDNPDVLLAIEAMRGMYVTASYRYYQKNKKNLEDIMDYIDSSIIFDSDSLTQRIKIAEKCNKIKAEFDEMEKNVEAERGKMKTKANRTTGKGEL